MHSRTAARCSCRAARHDGPRRPGPRRLARPGLGARPGNDRVHLGGRPDHPGLGGGAAADRPAGAVPRRRGRPLRPLPAAGHPTRSRSTQPAQPSCLLALRRPRVLRISRGRSVALRGGRPPAPDTASAGELARRRADRARCRRDGRLARRPAAARPAPAGRAGRATRWRDGRTARARRRRVAYPGNKSVRVDLHPARRARVALAPASPERPRVGPRRRLHLGLAGPIVLLALVREPVRPRVRRSLVSRRAGGGRLRAGLGRRDRARLGRVRRAARRGLRRALRPVSAGVGAAGARPAARARAHDRPDDAGAATRDRRASSRDGG